MEELLKELLPMLVWGVGGFVAGVLVGLRTARSREQDESRG